MSELLMLKKQMQELQEKVIALESKGYVEPITKRLSRLKRGIFNSHFDFSEREKENRYVACHQKEYIQKAVSDLSNSVLRTSNKTLERVTSLVRNDREMEKYLAIYEHFCIATAKYLKEETVE